MVCGSEHIVKMLRSVWTEEIIALRYVQRSLELFLLGYLCKLFLDSLSKKFQLVDIFALHEVDKLITTIAIYVSVISKRGNTIRKNPGHRL